MKKKISLLLIIATMTLSTGCGTVIIGHNTPPTQKELLEAKEDLSEAKEDLQKARDEIAGKDDISNFEKNISYFVIDIAENTGISVAEKYIDRKLNGDD